MTAEPLAIPPCSHHERLEEDYEGERPEWVPEGVWPLLKQDLVLSRAGVNKASNQQLADKWNLPLGRLRGLLQSSKWVPQFEEERSKALLSAMVANQRAATILHDKLNDPEKVAKMGVLDSGKLVKLTSDTMLNLSNGNTGGGITVGNINFADVKALLNINIKKPGEGA